MLLGWGRRAPLESSTWPKRPSWNISVTYSVCVKRTSMPSKRSRYATPATAAGTGRLMSTGVTLAVLPQSTMPVALICV